MDDPIDPKSGAAASVTAEPAPDATPDANPERQAMPLGTYAHLPLHVNARGLALGIIATVSFVFALQWAQSFLIPLVFSIFIAYTLNPLVVWLERLRVARVIGATLVGLTIIGAASAVVPTLQGEFRSIFEELPAATHKLSHLLKKNMAGQPSAIQKMQAAATEIAQATGTGPSQAHKGPVAPDGVKVIDWVWAGSMGVLGFVGQATMVSFLVFFLLLAGDTFKRKLVKLTGPSLHQKKITVHILNEINSSIQKYMSMLLVTNILLALLMWIALRTIGLVNAGAWAMVAGFLHIMPYFGPLLIAFATGLVALLQFESLRMALLVAGVSLAIATLIGTVVTTWMTGRIARMNPAAVFVSLLFWGWLWGVWGMLLGVPVIVILKVVAERVEGMEFVAELLGE
ncbi:AI-2 transport protein TqsA [mine drainage metagenome]|uniref:AI-2 transport protein TqsA n=1 Tax=mine drainage metagenome TaxID=410659 RepID=A0A1J5R9L9_9ZZZZ